jgi:hypothetical protein
MARFLLLLARTAGVFLLAVLGARAVVNSHVVWLDASPAARVSPGPVAVSLPGAAEGVTLDTPGLVPGETAAAAVDLVVNTGASTVTLTTMAASSSLLDRDPVNGLRLGNRCSVPWEAVPGATRVRYRCPGRSVSVLVPRRILASSLPLSNLDAVADGGTQHLLISLTLPESAGNEFQGLSSTIEYAFAVLQT